MEKPVHGNYHGYYTKRQALNDPRLALIPRDIWTDARVLDVGCNEGWITCEIAHSYGVSSITGVDLDDTLISAAWRRRRAVWSCYGPNEPNERPEDLAPDQQLDCAHRGEPAMLPQQKYPAAFEHMFGPLPVPPIPGERDNSNHSSHELKPCFPHNVTFRTGDWVKNGVLEDRDGYDIVLAFSLTKWIHLNDGDDGLLELFRRVYNVLRPGGIFILEPQEWETYAKAKRMDVRLKENARHLQLRPEDFERALQEIGFSKAEHLGTTGKGGFCRPLDLYRKL